MPRIPLEDELDDLSPAEQARMGRRDHDATANARALMTTGAAKQLKAMTEAKSYRGIPKVAKAQIRATATRSSAPRPKSRGRGR